MCGFSLVAWGDGPQLALTVRPQSLVASLRAGESVEIDVPLPKLAGSFTVSADVIVREGGTAKVAIRLDDLPPVEKLVGSESLGLSIVGKGAGNVHSVHFCAEGVDTEAAVCWSNITLTANGNRREIPIYLAERAADDRAPPELPPMRPMIARALVEWDWRMQDGIGTEREPSSYPEAILRTLDRGDLLLDDLSVKGVSTSAKLGTWHALRRECETISAAGDAKPDRWEDLWRRVHLLRREIVFDNPLARTGPLVFVKRVPAAFSHQLTQYYGHNARPGGGLFVLDRPGVSMQCRRLTPETLPTGSYQHPEVSYAGDRVLFSYCRAETVPADRESHPGRFYHLWEMAADGSNLRQLTDGDFDDFAPRYLPDGRIIFISTRRGGFHRCGRGPCPVYTLTLAEADGSHPRTISYHETHEWDPAVLDDGRIVYTRWDYVDRHAVHYQQLWTVRPDGSNVAIFYGNNTFNPVGVWEPRPVPGSNRVMATAAAHHAMTAGSIILLDVTRGQDGLAPITRLTPDALFPESEAPVLRLSAKPGQWHAPVGVGTPPPEMPDARRWPGHCYRSPYPLSEDYFLAAYSFDRLVGEPTGNPANMFGIYLVDRFGNKELLYRDLNISSQWPVPLRSRAKPNQLMSVAEGPSRQHGTFFLQDVYQGWPALEPGTVKRLRIVQVLPKTTPHKDTPRLGIPTASPGKQVLGTVPVEADGSAWFAAPAGIPLAFQALDEQGRAIQFMRSVTYLQPGEQVSCIGCHEPRTAAPAQHRVAQALGRDPSTIEPGPDGSMPLSYPILVQPVLDRRCVECHNRDKPEGRVVLTGEPQGQYTVSYNALAPLVPYSAWGGRTGDFRLINSEPVTTPGHFGAKGSKLMDMLLAGHEGVTLDPDEIGRLVTWMDANVLFYGTFDPDDQARQQRGERIEGPGLE